MTDWIRTEDRLPDYGALCETKIDDEYGPRNECRLRRCGILWYFDDMSKYVYYAPTHWRPV
jgi:hypothetical protein